MTGQRGRRGQRPVLELIEIVARYRTVIDVRRVRRGGWRFTGHDLAFLEVPGELCGIARVVAFMRVVRVLQREGADVGDARDRDDVGVAGHDRGNHDTGTCVPARPGTEATVQNDEQQRQTQQQQRHGFLRQSRPAK